MVDDICAVEIKVLVEVLAVHVNLHNECFFLHKLFFFVSALEVINSVA